MVSLDVLSFMSVFDHLNNLGKVLLFFGQLLNFMGLSLPFYLFILFEELYFDEYLFKNDLGFSLPLNFRFMDSPALFSDLSS